VIQTRAFHPPPLMYRIDNNLYSGELIRYLTLTTAGNRYRSW
jgi:hypothetical protein